MIHAKILVVGDNPAFCRQMEALLTHEGAIVVAAGSHEALAAFDAEKPDLVLLDLMMPGGDGFETCRRLREHSRIAIIIMLSPLDRTDYVVKAFDCGADDFVARPFHFVVMCARINALLRQARSPRIASS